MLIQMGIALLSGAIAVAMTLLFSKMDTELPRPKGWMLLLVGIGTAVMGFLTARRLQADFPVVMCLFMAYMAFTAYTDARIRSVYTVINILALVGMVAFYIIRKRDNLELLPIIVAAIFFAMGFAGAYGRGDGYALAAMVLYTGAFSTDVINGIFYMIIIGCGCFVIYSIADYVLHRIRDREHSNVKFWKEKRPLLPSMSIGLFAGLMIVG